MNATKFISGKNGVKLLTVFAACLLMAGIVYSNRSDRLERTDGSAASVDANLSPADLEKSKAAFSEAVKVFFSARCSNCHPAGDFPTQGDEMTQHFLDVMRGEDGKGLPEMSCSTCHQDTNIDGDGLPPGAPNWHMPPANQKMVFQGLTAGELCRQLKDPAQNGGRKIVKDAIKHIATDPLVLWAWSPGNDRTLPPMSHEDFIKKMNEWADNGAACPD